MTQNNTPVNITKEDLKLIFSRDYLQTHEFFRVAVMILCGIFAVGIVSGTVVLIILSFIGGNILLQAEVAKLKNKDAATETTDYVPTGKTDKLPVPQIRLSPFEKLWAKRLGGTAVVALIINSLVPKDSVIAYLTGITMLGCVLLAIIYVIRKGRKEDAAAVDPSAAPTVVALPHQHAIIRSEQEEQPKKKKGSWAVMLFSFTGLLYLLLYRKDLFAEGLWRILLFFAPGTPPADIMQTKTDFIQMVETFLSDPGHLSATIAAVWFVCLLLNLMWGIIKVVLGLIFRQRHTPREL